MTEHLLVVDDDRFLQENLVSLLTGAGFRVDTASSGEEALRSVNSNVPDLLILDLSLPDMDGLEVCRQIRLNHSFPIVMLTARSDAKDRAEGMEAGASDYLTKPFAASVLIDRIRSQFLLR